MWDRNGSDKGLKGWATRFSAKGWKGWERRLVALIDRPTLAQSSAIRFRERMTSSTACPALFWAAVTH